MCSDVAIALSNVSKAYRLYRKPSDRLWEALPFVDQRHESFQAVSDINLTVKKGEVVGIVGRNGAGKSTLLQLICGTLQPTSGEVGVFGRIAALLELGAGFNPEFSGRENVWMNASILGMSHDEIAARYDDIVAFSEIGEAIEHPVKTYSSGMFVRLAFAVAIHVSPDILVIDEALSVGDGAFAKKSFDRIMQLKASGCTILFCSHALYQVEAISDYVVWVNQGRVESQGASAEIISEYRAFLDRAAPASQPTSDVSSPSPSSQVDQNSIHQIVNVELTGGCEKSSDKIIQVRSEQDDLYLNCALKLASGHPFPSLGVVITHASNIQVCSFSSLIDCFEFNGENPVVQLKIPQVPLLKGRYTVDVFLLCERGIHLYEHLQNVAEFEVTQTHLEVGLVHIDRIWSQVNS